MAGYGLAGRAVADRHFSCDAGSLFALLRCDTVRNVALAAENPFAPQRSAVCANRSKRHLDDLVRRELECSQYLDWQLFKIDRCGLCLVVVEDPESRDKDDQRADDD